MKLGLMTQRLMLNNFDLIDKIKIVDIDLSIKKSFLEFIKKDSKSISRYHKDPTITKTSYHKNPYDPKLVELFDKHLNGIVRNVVKYDYSMNCIWYQIYESNSGSYHDYHTHCANDCHISAVLYLKLFDKKFSTEFIMDGSPKQFDVSEGDMIFFDSRIKHRSPPNYSPEDKIILSFNLDCSLDKS